MSSTVLSNASTSSLDWILGDAKPIIDRIPPHEWAVISGGFAGALALVYLVFAVTAPSAASVRTSLSASRWTSPTVFWLVLSGIVHMLLELHFVFFRDTSSFANSMDLYAAADFRYGRPLESGTASMEAITSLITGPLCFLVAFAAVYQKAWRHPLQIVLCTFQLYGLMWFIGHGLFHHEPIASSDPFLFWVIFVGLNAPWGIFPTILLIDSFSTVVRVFREHASKKAK